jgi:ABC-type transport system substrate-binding protein
MKRQAFCGKLTVCVATAFLAICLIMLNPNNCPGAQSPKGELRIAVSAMENESFDPAYGPPSNTLWNQLIYDQFIALDEHAKIDLGRGICWKYTQSPDGLTWTFHIRKGIKFHNGEELTAEDVKFCWERAQKPWALGLGGPTLRKIVKRIEVPDRYTVVVRLKKPYLFLWSIFSGIYQEGFIYPKKCVEEKGDEYFRRHPIGTGPYRLLKHEVGVQMVFEAVDRPHWRWGVPKYKRIVFRVVPEAKTRMALLRTGEVDIAPVPREWAARLSAYMEPDMVKPFPYDPKRAKELLKEAGYPNGFELRVMSWPRPGMAEGPKMIEAIAGYWNAIGIRTKIIPIDYGTWRKRWKENPDQGTVAGWYWVGSRVWPMAIVRALFASDGKLTYAKDPTLDRMIEEIEGAPNERELKDALWRLGRYMQREHINGTLFESAVPFGVSKKASGWFPGVMPYTWNFQQLFAGR